MFLIIEVPDKTLEEYKGDTLEVSVDVRIDGTICDVWSNMPNYHQHKWWVLKEDKHGNNQ